MNDSKIESAKNPLACSVPPTDWANNLGASIPVLYQWVPDFERV